MRSYAFIAAALAAQVIAGPIAIADEPVELVRRAPASHTSSTAAAAATTTNSQVSFQKLRRWWHGPWGQPQQGPGAPPSGGQAQGPSPPQQQKTTIQRRATKKRKTTSKKKTTAKKSPNSNKKAIPAGPTSNNYIDAVVRHHNYHRHNHSAPSIKWSPRMASYARKVANSCVYAHNVQVGAGGYGQNIAAGAPMNDIAGVITNQFYDNEVNKYPKYNTDNPDMTNFESWGHFSQVVWKGTTHVGCYTIDCSKAKGGLQNISDRYSNIAPIFTVCNYWPPGNYEGEYTNVGAPTGYVSIDGNFRVNDANIHSPNPPPLSHFNGQTTG